MNTEVMMLVANDMVKVWYMLCAFIFSIGMYTAYKYISNVSQFVYRNTIRSNRKSWRAFRSSLITAIEIY